jgi:hypothetical protein
LDGAAIAVYWNDKSGGFRYWPSTQPETYGDIVGDGCQWHPILYTAPALNPTRVPHWTEPYVDSQPPWTNPLTNE